MHTVKLLYWISLGVLFYCYIGYGMLVWLINVFKKLFTKVRTHPEADAYPAVTLIITAYNEENVLPGKISNTLAIDYPAGKLTVLFVTDGSTDKSAALFAPYPSLQLLHQPERKGKYAAIRRAMERVETPIVVFSDANTILNPECIKRIVAHYTDKRTGGVAGEKKIAYAAGHSAVGPAEGLYWRYESFMKAQDAGLHTVVGAAGELFSIRTALFQPLEDDLVLDDFVISMQVCIKGYTIAYEPGAFATELPSVSLAEEEKRKVRISAGAYQSVKYVKGCLNFIRRPLLCFQFVSRRLLRWVFCPVLLVVLLATNIILAMNEQPAGWYSGLLVAQLFFYLLALMGWAMVRAGKRPGLLTIPFYFVFMNYCLVKGFVLFAKGKHTVLWEKALRQSMVNGEW